VVFKKWRRFIVGSPVCLQLPGFRPPPDSILWAGIDSHGNTRAADFPAFQAGQPPLAAAKDHYFGKD
jgi:hypothetical protein